MGQPLLGPDGGDDLALGVYLHPEPAPVAVGHRLAQVGQPPRGPVAVVAPGAGRLDQLVDDERGAGQVGVSESEVDDVLAGPARLGLELVDLGEDIRGQVVDPAELHRR